MSNHNDDIDNNQRIHGFFNPRFIQNLIRNIGPHFNGQDHDEDVDMPALEPIDNNVAPRLTPVDPPASPSPIAGPFQASSSTGVNRLTHDNDSDSMPDLQSVSDSSESESEGDADEVETMQDLQPVDDDNDSAWTDEDSGNRGDPGDDEEMPALEPVGSRPQGFRSSNRRARVDDDDDEDRDRRHPSQRTNNDEPNNTNANNQHQQPLPQPHAQHQQPITIPGFVHIVSRGPLLGMNPDGTADTFQLFQRLFGGATRESNTNLSQPENPPANVNVPAFAGGFTITLGTGPFRVETGGPHPQDHPDAHVLANAQRARAEALRAQANAQRAQANALRAQANAQHAQANANTPHVHPHPPVPMFADMPGGGAPGAGNRPEEMVDVARFAELMARFGVGLEQALGIAREEREDPERAKRLVDGLDEVPLGLVKRFESVGGAPGGHVDASVGAGESEDTGSVPGCAICWDRLLDAEGDGFVMKEDGEIEKVEAQVVEDNTSGQAQTEPLPNALPPSARTEPKIVSLPCSHVFHASCLLPWFSRPMQTTCPTCRFNVDPENLTFVRRPGPSRMRAPSVPAVFEDQNANAPGAGTGVDGNAGEEGVGAHPIPGMHVHIVDLNGPGGPPAAQPARAPTTTNVGGLPPNANPAATPNGGFWTFGIDMIFQDERPGNEDDNDEDMEDDGSDVPDMRQAENFAQEFIRQEFGLPVPAPDGFSNFTGAAPAPDADRPPTGTDDPGAHPGIQFAQFVGMNANAFVAGPNRETQPQSLGEFMQMFQGAMGGAGGNQPAGAAPAQAAGGNMPTGDGLAAFSQLFGGALPTTAGTPNGPHIQTHGPPGQSEKKPWSPPPPPGATLRQRVERREREAGLRCFDMSCGMGPSDEEPFVTVSDAGMKQLSIRPSKNNLSAGMGTSVCSHTFHPSCLVSAVRISLRGAGEEVVGEEVEVSCPSCRAAGCISKGEWGEGVAALA